MGVWKKNVEVANEMKETVEEHEVDVGVVWIDAGLILA